MKLLSGKLLKDFSTFGIGGPARLFTEVKEISEMQEVMMYCHKEKIPFLVIGKGSNCLFDDRGFNGLVILNKICFCKIDERRVDVGAGYAFSLLGVQTARKQLGGLEFASGIPGSVGGAVYMNAGASGAETADVLKEVSYVHPTGELEVLVKEKIHFAYRSSSFQKMPGVIVAATFFLNESKEARAKQLKIIDYRTRTQPYGDLSAGCVFRNPQGFSAGALIEQCGLKGKKIGGAEVSLCHANFLINSQQATAQDILELAAHVKETVKREKDVELEMEIRFIPYEKN